MGLKEATENYAGAQVKFNNSVIKLLRDFEARITALEALSNESKTRSKEAHDAKSES